MKNDNEFDEIFDDDIQQVKRGVGGRKNIPENEKLKNKVSVLFTDDEFEQLKKVAGAVPLAIYIRMRVQESLGGIL